MGNQHRVRFVNLPESPRLSDSTGIVLLVQGGEEWRGMGNRIDGFGGFEDNASLRVDIHDIAMSCVSGDDLYQENFE